MSPDDPRHGTNAGASAHWKDGERPCDPCREAGSRRRKLNRLRSYSGQPGTVPFRGTLRRLRALRALGWSNAQIAARTPGVSARTLDGVGRGPWVHRDTADAIAAVYEELCMTFPPPSRVASYNRTMAKKFGWAPPLAWDDIDRDPAPVVVDEDRQTRRIHTAGQRLAHEVAEEYEAFRAMGMSKRDIARRLGLSLDGLDTALKRAELAAATDEGTAA